VTADEARAAPRVAVAGGPRSGKTTLSDSIAATRPGDPLLHTDDYMDLEWSEASEKICSDCAKLERFIIEGVRVAHALRKGLAVDAVFWLGESVADRTPEQESMAKAVATVFDEWREGNGDTVPVFGPTGDDRMRPTAAAALRDAGYEPDVRVRAAIMQREEKEGVREIAGIAATDTFSGDGVRLLRSGFDAAIADFMASGGPLQLGHRMTPEASIGTVTEAKFTEAGMEIRARLSRASDVDPIWTRIQEGILRDFSLGFKVLDGHWDVERDEFAASEFAIIETSVLRFGADPVAKFEVARGWRERFPQVKKHQPVARRKVVRLRSTDGRMEEIAAVAASVAASRYLLGRRLLNAVAQRV
jgi:HK97 family phage prohead protease